MKSSLVRPVGVVLCSLLFSGCLAPGTIKPIAADNAQNIANFKANLAPLLADYAKLVAAMGRLEKLERQGNVSLVLNQYVNAGTGLPDAAALDAEVAKLTALLASTKAAMNDEAFASFQRDLAVRNPVTGDVVVGTVSRQKALDVIQASFNLKRSGLPLEAQQAAEELTLGEFQLVADWTQSMQDTLAALDLYIALLNQHAELAMNHAKTFSAFADSKAQFTAILDSTLSNPAVQTSILDLVLQNTKDPKRQAAAKVFLAGIADAVAK